MIDAHVHFCETQRYGDLVSFCDLNGIERAGLVSLPKADGTSYNPAILYALERDPSRFFGYGCLEYGRIGERGAVGQVRDLQTAGFSGLKLWIGKPSIGRAHGMQMVSGEIEEAVCAAGELGMPVLVHAADPPAFWEKGGMYAKDYPPFSWYIAQFEQLLGRCPGTNVICAHLLFLSGGDLGELSAIMDRHQNLSLDTAPGRWFYRVLSNQREESIEFFTRYRERILFGSDAMFFSKTDKLFPWMSVEENSRTVQRIHTFLSSHEMLDDPYPWGDDGEASVRSLGLPEDVTYSMFLQNCMELFRDEKE